MRIYLDTSALVKLVVAEDESQSLQSFLSARADDSLFSAALACASFGLARCVLLALSGRGVGSTGG